jgi:hypothetical protein
MRGGYVGSDAFAIDVSDIRELAQEMGGPQVDRIVTGELTTAGHKSGGHDKRLAATFIKSHTGRLASDVAITTRVSGSAITTNVEWRARSSRGFAYSRTVHDGRGPVVARRAKALHFFIDGQEFFRKRVGPAKGTRFAERGLQAAEAAIVAEHQRAADRAASRIEAL